MIRYFVILAILGTLIFVGLQDGYAEKPKLEMQIMDSTLNVGDYLLVMIRAPEQVIVNMQLIDPNGTVWRELQMPTNIHGVLAEERFRAYAIGGTGTWSITATNQGYTTVVNFEVQ